MKNIIHFVRSNIFNKINTKDSSLLDLEVENHFLNVSLQQLDEEIQRFESNIIYLRTLTQQLYNVVTYLYQDKDLPEDVADLLHSCEQFFNNKI